MNTKLTFTKRQALSLAAALTLAVGKAAAAVAGLAHTPSPVSSRPAIAASVSPAVPVTSTAQEVDD